MAELYFLEGGSNVTDLPLFRRRPSHQFLTYLKANNAPDRVVTEVQTAVMGVAALSTPHLPGATPSMSPSRQGAGTTNSPAGSPRSVQFLNSSK